MRGVYRGMGHRLMIGLTFGAASLSCSDTSGPRVDRGIGSIGIFRADTLPFDLAVVVAESLPLRAVVIDTNGVVLPGRAIVWSTTQPAADIDANGLTVGVTPGITYIRASSGGVRDSVRIEVLPVADSMVITPVAVGIVPGGTAQVVPLLYAGGAQVPSYGRPVHWSSSDTTAVRVTGRFIGDLVAVAPGSSTLTATGSSRTESVTVDVDLLSYAVIDAGVRSSCGLTQTTRRVYCWGVNNTYQLGHPFVPFDSLPLRVEGIPVATQVVFGGSSACALSLTGAAWCWGFDIGNLGRGVASPNGAELPGLVSGGLSFFNLAMGEASTCGATTGAVAYCWGFGGGGVLGTGDTLSHPAPVPVSGGLSIGLVTMTPSTPIASYPFDGQTHTCGLTTSATGYCWGRNRFGQLGDSSTTDRLVPVPVAGGLSLMYISAGWTYSCAVAFGGAGYCWGDNTNGQLGSAGGADSLPRAVAGGLTFNGIWAGTRHTCGVTVSGAAYCWGANSNGELGDGTRNPSSVPVAVAGGLSFFNVTPGVGFTCGVTTGYVGYCWGGVEFETGNGVAGSAVPVRILGQP